MKDHSQSNLTLGVFTLNRDARNLQIGSRQVNVTPLEFNLVELLMLHPGRVFSRRELIEECWPEDSLVTERAVDVNISRLRRKLGSEGANAITARSGFGYTLTI